MTGFLASEPTPPETPINSGAFWPEIDLAELREAMRLDGTVTPSRLRMAAISSVASVNSQLREWRLQNELDGYETLAEVPAEEIDGESAHLHSYRTAVYNLTAAMVNERTADFDSTDLGRQKAQEQLQIINDLKRDAGHAIADIQGNPRRNIELY